MPSRLDFQLSQQQNSEVLFERPLAKVGSHSHTWLFWVLIVLSVLLLEMGLFLWLNPSPVVPRSVSRSRSPREGAKAVVTLAPLLGKTTINHTFTVVNDTERLVDFSNVRPSCGCANHRLKKKTLAPGDATELELEVHLNPKGDSKQIVVHLDNNLGEPWVYVLNVTAVPYLQIDNALKHIDFGSLDPGETATKSVNVFTYTPANETPPPIQSVKSDTKYLVVELDDRGVEDLGNGLKRRTTSMLINLKSQSTAKDGLSHIDIVGSSPEGTVSSRLSVAWRTRSLFEVSPSRLYLDDHVSSETKTIERLVSLHRKDGSRFQVLKVETSHPAIKASLLDEHDPCRAQVAVVIDPEKVNGSLSDEVRIHTNSVEERTVVVVVSLIKDFYQSQH